MPSSIQFRSCSFTHRNKRIPFLVYSGGDHPDAVTEAQSGDLFLFEGVAWVRTEWGWEIGVAEGDTKYRTRYPNFTDRILDHTKDGSYRWISCSTYRTHKHRALIKNTVNSGNNTAHVDDMQADNLRMMRTVIPRLIPNVRTSGSVEDTTQNAWLKGLKEEWTDTRSNTPPSMTEGTSIMDALLALPFEISQFPTFNPHHEIFASGKKPTLNDVISDMLARSGLGLCTDGRSAYQETHDQSEAGLIASLLSNSCPINWNLSIRYCGVVAIPFRPEGMQTCNFQIPRFLQEDAIFDKPEGEYAWVSSLCLAGSLTNIHVDYIGTARLIVNIQCNMLWLLWPATSYNLGWWDAHHRHKSDVAVTIKAIEEMERLELLHAWGQQAFVLPPYHFYAIIALDNSAYASISFLGFRWWEWSKRGLEWNIERASTFSSNDSAADDIISVQREGLRQWASIIEKFPDHRRTSGIRRWIREMDTNVLDMAIFINDKRQRHEMNVRARMTLR